MKARKEHGKGGRGSHPNSRRALEPTKFKPGESGNPAGKPEGTKDRATVLKRWLSVETQVQNPGTLNDQKGTIEDDIMLALITKARMGDVPAIKEVQDSVYGRAPQPVKLSDADGENLTFTINLNGKPAE